MYTRDYLVVIIIILIQNIKIILADLHEFLTAVYAEYDIMIWSATRQVSFVWPTKLKYYSYLISII